MAIWATELALSSEKREKIYDPILDGLRSAIRYDRTYFDKIVASLLPLLEKLTTGKTAAPVVAGLHQYAGSRPIFDWQQVIRKKGLYMSGWMRYRMRKWRQRWGIPCLRIWSR